SELGLNSRLDELQAAILRVKLPHLDAWNEARRAVAERYHEALAGLRSVVRPPGPSNRDSLSPSGLTRCVYHQYTVRVHDRDTIRSRLKEAGVETMIYYPVPLHRQEVHRGLAQTPNAFPVADQAAAQCLSLPMFPELSQRQQDAVLDALVGAVGAA